MTDSTAATQSARILRWLKTGRSITPMDALQRFGCFRLAARIYDLRKEGYQIVRKPTGEQWARYVLKRAA